MRYGKIMLIFSLIPLLVTIITIPLVTYLRLHLYSSPVVLDRSSTPTITIGSFLTHVVFLTVLVWVLLLIVVSIITWLVLLPIQSLGIGTDYNPLNQFAAIFNFGWPTWLMHFIAGVLAFTFSLKFLGLQEKRLI